MCVCVCVCVCVKAYAVRQVADVTGRQVTIPWLGTRNSRLVAPPPEPAAMAAAGSASTVLSPFNLAIVFNRQTDVHASVGNGLTMQVKS